MPMCKIGNITERTKSDNKHANQTPTGANRVNPASAGYHETHPKAKLGQRTPYLIYFTCVAGCCQGKLDKFMKFQ